jgi:hypothetical protein
MKATARPPRIQGQARRRRLRSRATRRTEKQGPQALHCWGHDGGRYWETPEGLALPTVLRPQFANGRVEFVICPERRAAIDVIRPCFEDLRDGVNDPSGVCSTRRTRVRAVAPSPDAATAGDGRSSSFARVSASEPQRIPVDGAVGVSEEVRAGRARETVSQFHQSSTGPGVPFLAA